MTCLSPRDALLFSLATLTPQITHLAAPFDDADLDPVILRDYQMRVLREAVAYFRMGFRRVLIQLPTGGGKTVLAAQVLLAVLAAGGFSQFIVHRKELLNQTSRSFTAMGLPHGFIAADRPLDLEAATILAGVQTLVNRLDVVLPPNLVVLDEAHHCVAGTWERVLAAYPDAYILGLTATPERLDGRGLGEHFDVMVLGPTTAELIERGFLSPYDYYAPHRPDLSGLHTLGGDYNQTEVQALMDRPELVGDMVSHYLRLAGGQKGIVFASSIAHSRNLADAFRAAGVRAAHLDGTSKDREAVMEGFCGDRYDVLSNVDLFDEGLDVPGIVYVGMGRPTKSMTKYRQQAGRALRLAEGKTRAIIADHAGNAFIHGLPDDDYEWSLEGRSKAARGACNDDAEPVRQCLTCYRVYPSKVKACPGCGAAQTPTAREIKIREGELEKLERERLKQERAERRKAEEKACKTYDDYYRLAVARGYNEPVKWARARSSMRSRSFRFR